MVAAVTNTLLSIQYLRALAALSVLVFHAGQWARVDFDVGSAGVDVFFVVSGFIMWRTTEQGGVGPREFLRRRAIRIVPLYWAVTLGLVAAALAFPARFPDIEPQPWHVLASLAFIQHLNPQGLPFPVLAPGWTLNYEAVFYLVFAAGLLVPVRRRAAVLTLALGSATVIGFMHPPLYIMLFNPLLLEFAAGMWLAKMRFAPGRAMGWNLFVLGIAAFALMHAMGTEWDLWRPLFWGFPALLVVAGLTAVEADGGLKDIPLLRTLGDASYSIYLCHPLTVGAVAVTMGAWYEWAFMPVAIVVGAASGWIAWRIFERPAQDLLRGRALKLRHAH